MLANPAPGPAGRSTHPGRTNVGALAPAASALLGVALLTGCSSGITESVSTAVKDSSSAVATARIALRQDMAGKLTRAATSTTLDDGLKELQSSRSTVLKLSPVTTVDRGTQRQALDALDQCAAGFATARAALAAGDGGTPSLADGDKALADAQDVLKQLESTVASP